MASEGAMPGRLMRWIASAEPDWDAVYAEQLPRVYNFFRYRCGPGADVEELTSRTFEKAWRARHRYRRDLAGFGTWLLSIARNVAIDEFRAQRRYLPLEAAASLEAGGRSPEEAAEPSTRPRRSTLPSGGAPGHAVGRVPRAGGSSGRKRR